jgi:hypothetical protein
MVSVGRVAFKRSRFVGGRVESLPGGIGRLVSVG